MTDASIRSERRDDFPTDSDIALDSSEDRQQSRRLQKWSEGSEVQNKAAFGSLDEQNSNSNWTPQAMFEHHEKKYNFKSTYNELEYTTPLPEPTGDLLMKATRIEHEIIREGLNDEEDYERTEEELFSKVMRSGQQKSTYYRPPQKQVRRKNMETEKKMDKRDIHPEAMDLPEWRQEAFSKVQSTFQEKDEIFDRKSSIDNSKIMSENNEINELEEFGGNVPKTHSVDNCEIKEDSTIPGTNLKPKNDIESTPDNNKNTPIRSKTSVQKRKDAIKFIETHSREEIKQNFMNFSNCLTPVIVSNSIQPESTNSSADLSSNSFTNLDLFTGSKSVPDLESSSRNVRNTAESTKIENKYSSIKITEDWDFETDDKSEPPQIQSENTSFSEQSSVQSQATPIHTHTFSRDSQDSGALDSESDSTNVTSESENPKSSTLNPQAEEFRFDMSKLSDVILQDPSYMRTAQKKNGSGPKYPKQPNASMRGRGNLGGNNTRGDRSKKPTSDIPLPLGPGGMGKGKSYNDPSASIVGPPGYSMPKRNGSKRGKYRANKQFGYKPNFEMEQLYALHGSQFQMLANPNGVFYQHPGHMPQLQPTAKPVALQQQMQLGVHPAAASVQGIPTMPNPQLAMQQVTYPAGFTLQSQMPEDPQPGMAPQPNQIFVTPDVMAYFQQGQTDYTQHYSQQLPPPTQHQQTQQPSQQQPAQTYAHLQPTETSQQFIFPPYIQTNAGPQHGYVQVDPQQNQVLYTTPYPGQHPQGIIPLQNNNKTNMY